jgi:hypothetical protein
MLTFEVCNCIVNHWFLLKHWWQSALTLDLFQICINLPPLVIFPNRSASKRWSVSCKLAWLIHEIIQIWSLQRRRFFYSLLKCHFNFRLPLFQPEMLKKSWGVVLHLNVTVIYHPLVRNDLIHMVDPNLVVLKFTKAVNFNSQIILLLVFCNIPFIFQSCLLRKIPFNYVGKWVWHLKFHGHNFSE